MKAGNVLLDQYKQVKICDFGISAFLPATQAGDTSNLDLGSGTPAMMAPELFAEVPPEPDPSVDIYAFGVLLWEMATRQRPWSTVHPAALPKLVGMDRKRPPLPVAGGGEISPADESADSSTCQQTFGPKFASLVEHCWDQDPARRPTASAAYNALKQTGGIFAEGAT
jgi:serine/threonine protein kinase